MERIINEFRVIETDDGFRIEIKGDKEKIKSFMSGFGKHRRGPHWHAHQWAAFCEPFGFHFAPGMWMRAASCCGEWDSDEEAEEAS